MKRLDYARKSTVLNTCKLNMTSFLKMLKGHSRKDKKKIFDALKCAFFKTFMARKRFSIRGIGVFRLAVSLNGKKILPGTIVFDTTNKEVGRNFQAGIFKCKDQKKLLKS